MKVIITVDGGIARYGHRLAALADQLPQIEREGLKEGGELTRTLIRRTLKAQMNTKRQGVINSHTSGTLAGDRTFIIKGVGKGLPITDFPVKGGKELHGDWRDQPRLARGRFGPLPDTARVVATPLGGGAQVRSLVPPERPIHEPQGQRQASAPHGPERRKGNREGPERGRL